MLNRWAKAKWIEIEAELFYDTLKQESALTKSMSMALIIEEDPKIAEWKCKARAEHIAANSDISFNARMEVVEARRQYLRTKLAADYAWERIQQERLAKGP